MITLHELQAGDTVLASYDGQTLEGRVTQVDHASKQACVLTNEAENIEFWYDLNNLYPILVDEAQLLKHDFHKDDALSQNGSAVYVRGPFSVKITRIPGEDQHIDLHYRDETRMLKGEITMNELQNHYHDMTNFHLE
jgi:hypothetical protein